MFAEALSIAVRPFVWLFGVVAELLYRAGALPAYVVMFAAWVVVRILIAPIVGEAGKEVSAGVKQAGKDNYKKLRGDD